MEAWKLLVLISAKESATAARRNRATQKQQDRKPMGQRSNNLPLTITPEKGEPQWKTCLHQTGNVCVAFSWLLTGVGGLNPLGAAPSLGRCKKASWASPRASQRQCSSGWFPLHAPTTSLHYPLWAGSARWKQHLSSKLPLVTRERRL